MTEGLERETMLPLRVGMLRVWAEPRAATAERRMAQEVFMVMEEKVEMEAG